MKIMILGGGGFIGSAIADKLLVNGHEVIFFERPRVVPYRKFLPTESVRWITGDLLSFHDVSCAIEDVDVVLHLVSFTLPGSSNDDPIYDVQTNLVATLQLLNAMVVKRIARIIFISSGGTVYGIPRYLPVDESHPTDPIVSYGITKLTIEKYLLMYERKYSIRAIILRVSNPFGERQRVETGQGAVAAFLHRAISGKPIEIWGDGRVTRDYLYIGDVADAFDRAISYSGSRNVFNVSSGVGTSLNELICLVEEVIGQPVKCSYLPGRPFDVPVSILKNDLVREEFAWSPKVSLLDGMRFTAEGIRKNLS